MMAALMVLPQAVWKVEMKAAKMAAEKAESSVEKWVDEKALSMDEI